MIRDRVTKLNEELEYNDTQKRLIENRQCQDDYDKAEQEIMLETLDAQRKALMAKIERIRKGPKTKLKGGIG